MRAQFHVAVLIMLLMMLPGCLSTSEETLGGVGTYEVEATWTTVELETKTEPNTFFKACKSRT